MGTGHSVVLSPGITILLIGIAVTSSSSVAAAASATSSASTSSSAAAASSTSTSSSAAAAAAAAATLASTSAAAADTMSIWQREPPICIQTVTNQPSSDFKQYTVKFQWTWKGENIETRHVKTTKIVNYSPKEPHPDDGRILMDPCSELASAKLKLSWDVSALEVLAPGVVSPSSKHPTDHGQPGVETVLCIRKFARFDDHTVCYNLTSNHLENNTVMHCWLPFIPQRQRMFINSYVTITIQKQAVYLFGQMPPFNGRDPEESCRWVCDTEPSIMSIYRCNSSGQAVVNSGMEVVSVKLRDSRNITDRLDFTVQNGTLLEFRLKQNLSGTFHFLIITEHTGSKVFCGYKKTITVLCDVASLPSHVTPAEDEDEGISFWLFSLVSCLVIVLVAFLCIIVCIHQISPISRRCGVTTGRRRRRTSKKSSRKTQKTSSKNGAVTIDRVAGRLSGQKRASCYSVIELDPTGNTGVRQLLLPETCHEHDEHAEPEHAVISETPNQSTDTREKLLQETPKQSTGTEHSLISETPRGRTRPRQAFSEAAIELKPAISVLLVPLPVNERNKELTSLLKSALLPKGNLHIQCIYDNSVYSAMSEDKYGWMTETAADKNKVILFLCFEPPGDIAPETLVGNELLKHTLLQETPNVFIGHTGCVEQYAGSRDTTDHVFDLREEHEYGQLLTELFCGPWLESDTRFQFGLNSLSAVLNSDASKVFLRKASEQLEKFISEDT